MYYRYIMQYVNLLDKPNAREYNWATLLLVEINTGAWPSRLGESQKQNQ
jgi:hypothetical protein